MSSHLNWWSYCNLMDRIRSELKELDKHNDGHYLVVNQFSEQKYKIKKHTFRFY